jgi:hypothetical protein
MKTNEWVKKGDLAVLVGKESPTRLPLGNGAYCR